jgi:hypothetical protein
MARGRPFQKGQGGRPKGARNKRTLALQQFNRSVLESPQYRLAFRKRLVAGTASAAEVQLAYFYGYGKPTDKIDLRVTDQVSVDRLVDSMTPQETAIMSRVLARLEAEENGA